MSNDRSLDSFSDETITRCRPHDHGGGLWVASLDYGPHDPGMTGPDFARTAVGREQAVRLCAVAIRDDQHGIGKYAPRNLDLWYLMRYWTEKERAAQTA